MKCRPTYNLHVQVSDYCYGNVFLTYLVIVGPILYRPPAGIDPLTSDNTPLLI